MGMVRIETWGSFSLKRRSFSAMEHGHAHAVAQAIQWLSEEVLPEAIERDCRLAEQGSKPDHGFDRPKKAGR